MMKNITCSMSIHHPRSGGMVDFSLNVHMVVLLWEGENINEDKML